MNSKSNWRHSGVPEPYIVYKALKKPKPSFWCQMHSSCKTNDWKIHLNLRDKICLGHFSCLYTHYCHTCPSWPCQLIINSTSAFQKGLLLVSQSLFHPSTRLETQPRTIALWTKSCDLRNKFLFIDVCLFYIYVYFFILTVKLNLFTMFLFKSLKIKYPKIFEFFISSI